MRMLSLLFLLFVSSFSWATPPAGSYPVVITGALKIKSIDQIPQKMNEQNVVSIQFTNSKNQKATADTCNEYFKLTKAGYLPANDTETAKEGYYRTVCQPLYYLEYAIPAKFSFVRDFDLSKDYKTLPAELIFPSLIVSSKPIGSLGSVFPDTQIMTNQPVTKYSVDLISKKANMRAHVAVLAFGDFNRDGYDNILLFVAKYVLDGNFHDYSTYVLTRKVANGPFILLDQSNFVDLWH